MKKLQVARERKILFLAILLISMIGGLMFLTAPKKAVLPTIAMATVVGKVTLEGKEEEVYLALMEAVKNEISKHEKGYITEEKMLEAIAKKISESKINIAEDESFKKLNDALEKQGLEIAKFKENGQEIVKSPEQQIKEQLGQHKTILEAMKAGKDQKLDLVIKIPLNPMTVGTMVAPASGFLPPPVIEPGYDRAPKPNRIIRSLANVAKVLNRTVVWAEKYGEEGDAAWLGEGGVKPPISFKLRTRESSAKKIAVSARFSTETLEDIPQFLAELKAEIVDVIESKEEHDFLFGDGQNENLLGLIPQIGGFVLTNISTDNPNIMDAIKAGITQILTLNQRPNLALINPIDKCNMELAKGQDGHYMLPPFMTADGTMISGVRIIESSEIAAGKVCVGDFSKLNIRDYIDLHIELGWANDDFLKNFVAILGERRLILYVKEHQKTAFLYDDLAVIKAAIETPAVPEPSVG